MREIKTHRDVVKAVLDGHEIQAFDVKTNTWGSGYEKINFDVSAIDVDISVPLRIRPTECSDRFESGCGSMALLDFFAAKAMQGLLANPAGPIQSNNMSGWSFTNCAMSDVADLAYTMAEKMLQARKPK